MGDLKGFGKHMRLLGATIEENADRLVRQVALAVDAEVVVATPVDTGRARANWRAAVGAPATEIVEAPGEPESRGGNREANGAAGTQAALASASSAAAAYQGEPGGIHITNSLDYIGALNNGHSALAPRGFVETAVQVGLEAVSNANLVTGEGLSTETVESGPAAGAGSAPGKAGG